MLQALAAISFFADGQSLFVHRRNRPQQSRVAQAHPGIVSLRHENHYASGFLEITVGRIIEHARVQHLATDGRRAAHGHAAAMKLLGEQVEAATVGPGKADGLRHGVAFGEEPRRHVRPAVPLDFRGQLQHRRRIELGILAEGRQNTLAHLPDWLAQQRSVRRPHLFGRAGNHQDRLLAAATEEAVSGRVAGHQLKRILIRARCRCASAIRAANP